jgi:orotate phosphoribosyltransferase
VIEIVREHGLRHLDEPIQLASGEWSNDFIDCKAAFANGGRLRIACEGLLEGARVIGVEFDAVGGLTMGADQFSHGMAIVAGCGWFSVRKVEKGRGTNKLIEGTPLKPGVRVLLVDDVVTMGGSIREAYEAIKTTGADVVGAVTVVDRSDIAADFFGTEGVPYYALVPYGVLGIERVAGGRSIPTATG